MTTDFYIISGLTVLSSYNWDNGNPFNGSVEDKAAYSTQNYISGYAPALKVLFKNSSISDDISIFNISYLDYTWNFGDYYNDAGNIVSLSCNNPVEHIFIMPGKYTVSLTQTETIQETVVDAPPDLCLNKYNLNWYWDNLNCSQVDAKTWNDTQCGAAYAKWWDSESSCLQKYCKKWSWNKLVSTEIDNNIKWEETINGAQYQKRWFYEANDTVCSIADVITTTNANQQTTTKQYIVEVLELSPVAALHCVTQPLTGVSPYTVQLSPRATKTGSFPIDRIDWDFGDGSPIKTVVRQGNNFNDSELIYNGVYTADSLDPRNFDVVHTYTRDLNVYFSFYPSITAYSSNTGTSDACSTLVGPILLPNVGINSLNFIKTKSALDGVLYTAVYDNTCTFFATVTGVREVDSFTTYTYPINRLQNSAGLPILTDGNNGKNYPPIFSPVCAPPPPPILSVLLQEENATTTGDLSALDAILQDDSSYILI